MDTKHVFLDIDGTLVGYDAKIPKSAITALELAKQNGHKMIISSGRPLYMIYQDLLDTVDFDGIIAAGGSCVIVGGEVIFESFIDGDDLKFVIDYCRREGIRYLLQTKDDAFAEQDFVDIVIPGMLAAGYNEELVEKAYGKRTIVDNVRTVRGAEKLSYFASPYSPDKISRDLEGKFYVVDFSVGDNSSTLGFGEMNIAGVNKATGIQKYLDRVGASIKDTIAIGDSANDLEMMEYANISVAMGNGTDKAKAAADFVTTSVDNDGIYNAFLKLGLI